MSETQSQFNFRNPLLNKAVSTGLYLWIIKSMAVWGNKSDKINFCYHFGMKLYKIRFLVFEFLKLLQTHKVRLFEG